MKIREKLSADILLPLANPETSISLTGLVNQLSDREDSSITLVNLIKSNDDMDRAKEVLSKARGGLKPSFCINETVRFDANPARGIIREAFDENVKTIVMGWHGPDNKNKKKGRVLDPVLRKSPCNVIIAKDFWYNSRELPRQIIVPLSGIKSNDELALRSAEKMIDPRKGGRITILYFNSSPIKLAHINFLMTQVVTRSNIRLDGIASDSEKPVKTTILQSREFDLLVMGINEPWLFRRGKPSYTERVAQESIGAMLMVRAPVPVKSSKLFYKKK